MNLASPEDIAHQDVHMDVSPALSSWGPGIAYSRLLRLQSGPDVELPSLALECDVCENWRMESPTSYLFDLRRDVRWQNIDPVNGRNLDANDVAYSYLRQSDPSLPNAPLLHNVDAVDALDQWTVRITLKSPDADGLLPLADGHTKIVAREVVNLKGDLREGPTVGSGPWVLEPADTDGVHVFTGNQDYFEQGLPLVNQLRIAVLTDEVTRSAAFQSGIIDVHQMSSSEWLDYVERVPSAPSLMVKEPGIGAEVAFKTSEPPFDSLQVRRAAMLAMDPIRTIEELWDGFGFVGSGFPAASPEWILTEFDVSGYFDNRGQAQSLAQDIGWTDLIKIKVGDFGEPYLNQAHALSVELKSIGLNAEVEILNRRDFGEKVWLGGDYQVMLGPPAPVTVPNGYLLPVLHSDGIWNTTGHRDEVLDQLLESQAVEYDPNKRTELIRQIQNRVLDEGYRFMTAARVAIWTWNPRLRDFYPNFAAFEYHHWAKVWLEG